MNLKLYTADGTSSQDKDYAIPEYEDKKGLKTLRQVLIAYHANKRQGNASTKTRSFVHGTGRKPWRQKGTGMARAGSRKSNIWRGGAVVFGPLPRDYSQHINRKMRRLALGRSLFDRASAGEVVTIEKFTVAEPKTRLFNEIIKQIDPDSYILVVDEQWDHNTLLAARNIGRIDITDAATLNAFDLSHYDKIILSEAALETVLNRIAGKNSKAPEQATA